MGVNTGQYFPGGFSYDSASLTATWTFTSPFHVDKLLLNLAGEATDSSPIDDQLGAGGQLLFGGRDFQLRFDVLSGDATGDRATTVTDLGNIGLRVGTVIGPPASEFYEHEFDANSDGAITVTDLANVGLRVGTVLPGGDPVPPGPPLIVVALVNDTGLLDRDSACAARDRLPCRDPWEPQTGSAPTREPGLGVSEPRVSRRAGPGSCGTRARRDESGRYPAVPSAAGARLRAQPKRSVSSRDLNALRRGGLRITGAGLARQPVRASIVFGGLAGIIAARSLAWVLILADGILGLSKTERAEDDTPWQQLRAPRQDHFSEYSTPSTSSA